MDMKEIREIFEEKGEAVYMDRKGEIILPDVYEARILDIIVTMKNGSKITIFCGECTTIDCTHEHPNQYVGLGDTLIEPIEDIQEIQVNWR